MRSATGTAAAYSAMTPRPKASDMSSVDSSYEGHELLFGFDVMNFEGRSVDKDTIVFDGGDPSDHPAYPNKAEEDSETMIYVRQGVAAESIRDVHFFHPEHGETVRSFFVKKHTGQIIWGQDENCYKEFAVLITLEMWYKELATSLIDCISIALTLFANFTFCITLFSPHTGYDHISVIPRVTFVILFVLFEAIIFGVCFNAATKEFQLHAEAPPGKPADLRYLSDESAGHTQRWLMLLRLSLFNVLNVDNVMRNLPMTLHPSLRHRTIFSSFQKKGVRCFITGYPSEFSYRADRLGNKHRTGKPAILCKVFLIIFRLYFLALMREHHQITDWTSVISSIPGMLVCGKELYELFWNFSDRSKYWLWLQGEHERLKALNTEDADTSKSRRREARAEEVTYERDLHFPNRKWTSSGPYEYRRFFGSTIVFCIVMWGIIAFNHYLMGMEGAPGENAEGWEDAASNSKATGPSVVTPLSNVTTGPPMTGPASGLLSPNLATTLLPGSVIVPEQLSFTPVSTSPSSAASLASASTTEPVVVPYPLPPEAATTPRTPLVATTPPSLGVVPTESHARQLGSEIYSSKRRDARRWPGDSAFQT